MAICTKYYIYGNTYPIKEDLKNFHCHYDPENKRWESHWIVADTIDYYELKRLCETNGCRIVPQQLSEQAKKIQGILNG